MPNTVHELGKHNIQGSEYEVKILEATLLNQFTLLLKGPLEIKKDAAKLMLVLYPYKDLRDYSECFYSQNTNSDILTRYSEELDVPIHFLTTSYLVADKTFFSAYLDTENKETVQIFLNYEAVRVFLLNHNFILEKKNDGSHFLNILER